MTSSGNKASKVMSSQENLLHELIEKSEKYLIPLGIWPSAYNAWIAIFNIIVLFSYSILVMIKNVVNPEGESIENAFTLANGGLCTGIYLVTMLIKKDKLIELLDFMKSQKIFANEDFKRLMIAGGKEYKKIVTALLCILPAGTIIRFLQPPLQYGYIQLFREDKSFTLPPAMGIPTFIFGNIPTYVLESLIRMLMLSTLIGICATFIASTLYICTQYNIFAVELENIPDDEEVIKILVEKHQKLSHYAKLLNEIYSPYFFADCFLSFINLSIMMFSLISHNAKITNYMMEIPMVAAGMSQLFFILYFGDRLIDATSQISTAIYKSEWYTKPVKTRKKILFIMMRGQRPQTLNFGGNNAMVASMLLFSQICQRAWGAFNILRSTV